MSWSPGFELDPSLCVPCARTPCRFLIYLSFLGSLQLQALVDSKVRRSWKFPAMRNFRH